MRQCSKCNEYHRIIGPRFNPSTNRLDFTCGTCRYEWSEPTADSKYAQGQADTLAQITRRLSS